MVGAAGFEPATLCSQSRCASQAALCPVNRERETKAKSQFHPVLFVAKVINFSKPSSDRPLQSRANFEVHVEDPIGLTHLETQAKPGTPILT